MPQHAGDGLDDTDREEGHRPADQSVGVLGRDPLVYRLAEDGGDESLATHPDDPGADAAEHGGELPLEHPPQVGRGRAQVRSAGVGQGKGAHEVPR